MGQQACVIIPCTATLFILQAIDYCAAHALQIAGFLHSEPTGDGEIMHMDKTMLAEMEKNLSRAVPREDITTSVIGYANDVAGEICTYRLTAGYLVEKCKLEILSRRLKDEGPFTMIQAAAH